MNKIKKKIVIFIVHNLPYSWVICSIYENLQRGLSGSSGLLNYYIIVTNIIIITFIIILLTLLIIIIKIYIYFFFLKKKKHF